MSAFVVSTDHIDAMISAGLEGRFELSWYWDGERHCLNRGNADEVGSMLLSENVRSVEYRYSPPGREAIYGDGFESGEDFNLPGTYVAETIAEGIEAISVPQWMTPYSYKQPRRRFSPVEILKAIDCFDYQSCETGDWRETEAYAFCQSLRDDMIGRLPGYSDAAWSI